MALVILTSGPNVEFKETRRSMQLALNNWHSYDLLYSLDFVKQTNIHDLYLYSLANIWFWIFIRFTFTPFEVSFATVSCLISCLIYHALLVHSSSTIRH